jgi:hypothetical protein
LNCKERQGRKVLFNFFALFAAFAVNFKSIRVLPAPFAFLAGPFKAYRQFGLAWTAWYNFAGTMGKEVGSASLGSA